MLDGRKPPLHSPRKCDPGLGCRFTARLCCDGLNFCGRCDAHSLQLQSCSRLEFVSLWMENTQRGRLERIGRNIGHRSTRVGQPWTSHVVRTIQRGSLGVVWTGLWRDPLWRRFIGTLRNRWGILDVHGTWVEPRLVSTSLSRSKWHPPRLHFRKTHGLVREVHQKSSQLINCIKDFVD